MRKFFNQKRKMIHQLWRMLGIHCCVTCKHFKVETETCEIPGSRVIYIGWLLELTKSENSAKNIGNRCDDWK